MQLMAESGDGDGHDYDGLGDSDIQQNVYEGGLKTWEGATDLARLLLDICLEQTDIARRRPTHVVEVSAQQLDTRNERLDCRRWRRRCC